MFLFSILIELIHFGKSATPFDSMTMLLLAIKFVWRQLGASHFSVRRLRLAHFFLLRTCFTGEVIYFWGEEYAYKQIKGYAKHYA